MNRGIGKVQLTLLRDQRVPVRPHVRRGRAGYYPQHRSTLSELYYKFGHSLDRCRISIREPVVILIRFVMNSRLLIGVVVSAVGTAFIGYCIYFDRKRRSDPEFKEKLRERKLSKGQGM